MEALKVFIDVNRVKKRYMNKRFEFEENIYKKLVGKQYFLEFKFGSRSTQNLLKGSLKSVKNKDKGAKKFLMSVHTYCETR